jgi:hypothetical protein
MEDENNQLKLALKELKDNFPIIEKKILQNSENKKRTEETRHR